MRYVFGLLACTALALLPLPAVAQNQSIDSPEQLRARLARVMERLDIEGLDRLHHWEGVDPEHAEALRKSFSSRFFLCGGGPARVIPGGSGTEEYVRGGYLYRTNLQIQGRIHIECTSGKWPSFQVPYGQHQGQFFLVNVVREAEATKTTGFDR